MTEFGIRYLAEHPDCIQACAAWAYGRWGVQKKEASLERALSIFQEGAQIETLPLTVIALNPDNELPVAMGSLWVSDGDEWQHKTPWIASVFTLYRYRSLGLAKKIINRLEQEAMRLGYNEIYLKSGSAASFYRKLGYQEIDRIDTDATAAGTETLFMKDCKGCNGD